MVRAKEAVGFQGKAVDLDIQAGISCRGHRAESSWSPRAGFRTRGHSTVVQDTSAFDIVGVGFPLFRGQLIADLQMRLPWPAIITGS